MLNPCCIFLYDVAPLPLLLSAGCIRDVGEAAAISAEEELGADVADRNENASEADMI